MPKILTTGEKKEEKFLRKKTGYFDFKKFSRKEISDLLQDMKKAMRAANGIGLSANQIGIDLSVFIAEVPDGKGNNKFYSVFNPSLQRTSPEKLPLEEGCLSVPGVYGVVPRYEKVVLSGFDKNGKQIKIKAWGLLAHVFQHEVDHLHGVLFADKANENYERPKSERLQERERKTDNP